MPCCSRSPRSSDGRCSRSAPGRPCSRGGATASSSPPPSPPPCALAIVALNGGLAATGGYDPLGTLAATENVYRNSLAQIRPYWLWVLGSPVAWSVTAGIAIAGAALVSLARGGPAAVALVVVVLIAAVAGVTKAETERIWLPFVPLAYLAAAEAGLLARRPRLVLGVLLAQAVLTQLLFATVS